MFLLLITWRRLMCVFASAVVLGFLPQLLTASPYPVVDTGENACYDSLYEITCPDSGDDFYGQDAQFNGIQQEPFYQDNGDGTVTDLGTGLMWVRVRGSKMSWNDAMAGASACTVGGYADWRAPTIKEVYSLILFSGFFGADQAGSTPFIDTSFFDFEYGDTTSGGRWIDCQDWSATPYVGFTMGDDTTIFGVNFADGRIKGYPKWEPVPPFGPHELYVRYVRGNLNYGTNNFGDNGDSTISDEATGLMWSKYDSQTGLNWPDALAWVSARNATNYAGYHDWRLPNAKELQSIVDYTRAPDVTNSPAINPLFVTSEFSSDEYPYFWTSTTIGEGAPGANFQSAVYVCFGRALGWMNIGGQWQLLDVHGAGAQRAEFKVGNPANYPHGHGPQGDVVRIYNYVRLVRGVSTALQAPKRSEIPITKFALHQNYPNPFNGQTTITFDVAEPDPVTLTAFNTTGQEVARLIDGLRYPRGRQTITFEAGDLPSGVYFYTLTAGRFTSTQKMLPIK
jgi:hypothetical protein